MFSSSLIQIPLMHQMAGAQGKVGVITARASALTQKHFEAVGAGAIPVAVAGMEKQPEFSATILGTERNEIDEKALSNELVQVGQNLLRDAPDIKSIVLECTDLPPYASALQKAVNLPVADLTTFAFMVHSIVSRSPYEGGVQYD